MYIEAKPELRGAAKQAAANKAAQVQAIAAIRPFVIAAIACGFVMGMLPGLCVYFGLFEQLGLYGTIACIGSAIACYIGAMAIRRLV